MPPSRPSRSGMCSGFFFGSPGVGGSTCATVELGGLRRLVVVELADELRRAGLRVPGHELGEVAPAGVLEAGDEVLDRRRLAVVALEVEVHALAEALAPEQRLEHAHDLGALLVDGGRVEVVDLDVASRGAPDGRAGRRPRGTGAACSCRTSSDALHRGRALVGGELLVAEDGQPFLEAELEPVAAGDAVAGPVVEVLVRDDALDGLEDWRRSRSRARPGSAGR